jgi:hypothetical protein
LVSCHHNAHVQLATTMAAWPWPVTACRGRLGASGTGCPAPVGIRSLGSCCGHASGCGTIKLPG